MFYRSFIAARSHTCDKTVCEWAELITQLCLPSRLTANSQRCDVAAAAIDGDAVNRLIDSIIVNQTMHCHGAWWFSDVNMDWTCKKKDNLDKDKDQAYKEEDKDKD